MKYKEKIQIIKKKTFFLHIFITSGNEIFMQPENLLLHQRKTFSCAVVSAYYKKRKTLQVFNEITKNFIFHKENL